MIDAQYSDWDAQMEKIYRYLASAPRQNDK